MIDRKVNLRLFEEGEQLVDRVGLWFGNSVAEIGGKSTYAYRTSPKHEGITLNTVSINQTVESGDRIHICRGSLISIRPQDPKYCELKDALINCGGWQ